MAYQTYQPWGPHKPDFGYGLDPSSPFAQGLLGLWLFNEGGGGTAYSLGGRGNFTPGAGVASNFPAWIPGQGLSFDGSHWADSGFNPLGGLVQATVAMRFVTPASFPTGVYCARFVSNYYTIFGWNTAESGGNPVIAFAAGVSAGANTIGRGATHLQPLTEYWGFAVFDGTQATNATKLQVYLGSAPETVTYDATVPSALFNFNANMGIGRDAAFAPSTLYPQAIGSLKHVAIWNRPLSGAEIASYVGDSHQAVIGRRVRNSRRLATSFITATLGSSARAGAASLNASGSLNATLNASAQPASVSTTALSQQDLVCSLGVLAGSASGSFSATTLTPDLLSAIVQRLLATPDVTSQLGSPTNVSFDLADIEANGPFIIVEDYEEILPGESTEDEPVQVDVCVYGGANTPAPGLATVRSIAAAVKRTLDTPNINPAATMTSPLEFQGGTVLGVMRDVSEPERMKGLKRLGIYCYAERIMYEFWVSPNQ